MWWLGGIFSGLLIYGAIIYFVDAGLCGWPIWVLPRFFGKAAGWALYFGSLYHLNVFSGTVFQKGLVILGSLALLLFFRRFVIWLVRYVDDYVLWNLLKRPWWAPARS